MLIFNRNVVKCLGIAFLLCSLTLTSPMGLWPFELLQALAMQVLLLGFSILILSIATRQWLSVLVSLFGVTWICWQLHPYHPLVLSTSDSASDFRVGVFNVYHPNQSYSEGTEAILHGDCDVLAVLEVSEEWDSALQNGLGHFYPYAVRVPHSGCCYGMSVYSRLPVRSDTVFHLTRDPVIRVTVDLNGMEVDVWSVHTRPPVFPNDTEERNLLLRQVAKEIAASDRPALLLGDLNIVPWAKEFKQMKAVSGMDDSRRGFLATYPMELGIPLIPIDHILHTDAFSTSFCRTVFIPGSDHKGLVAGMNYR